MREFILLIFLLGLFKLSAGTPSSLLDNRTDNEEFENSNATMISTIKFLSDPYFWLPVCIIVLLVLIWSYFRIEEDVDRGANVYNGGGYPPNNYANSGAYAFGDFDFRPRIYTSVWTAFPGRGLYSHDHHTD